MIRKLITISMLLLLNINYCFSQNDWEKGYIIKNQGDTVYGFIDNRDSRSNTKQCYFRKDEKEKTDIFGPNELIGYRYLDGKFYISKIIDGEGNLETLFFWNFLFTERLMFITLKKIKVGILQKAMGK